MTKKELVVVGGANGSGKTTFANEMISQKGYTYIAADAIAVELSPGDLASAAIAAGREFFRRVQRSLAGDNSFIVESTLSGLMFRRVLEQAKSARFEITIVYLFLDSSDQCVDRVAERVQKGGHHVPDEDVTRRYSRSLSNFWHFYSPLCDHWVLVYNSGEEMQDVAAGTADDYSVRDVDLFERFMLLLEADE
ncbi:MAG: AAA family ATPase [Planctomycetaceae bacterium]